VLREAGERKVSEELVGEGQFLALRFCRNCRKAYAIRSFVVGLQTEAVRRKLSASQEVKMETPAHWPTLKLPSAINAREEGYSARVVCDACGSAKQIAEEMA
jgi:hypothetical protein